MIRIALHGYARTGKDSAGKVLMQLCPQMKRVAFGDLIKEDLRSLVETHLGIDPFTEDDNQKRVIRDVLVAWGYANYA